MSQHDEQTLDDIAAEVQAKLADLDPPEVDDLEQRVADAKAHRADADDYPNPHADTRKPTRAEAQAAALRKASEDSPIRTLRYWLATMAREWDRAAAAQREAPDEVAVEMVGALAPGSVIYSPGADGQSDLVVIRVMGPRDGQVSLHLEGVDGRPVYRNYLSLTSPVAVIR